MKTIKKLINGFKNHKLTDNSSEKVFDSKIAILNVEL